MVMISSSILKQDKGLMPIKTAPSRKTPPGNAVRDFLVWHQNAVLDKTFYIKKLKILMLY